MHSPSLHDQYMRAVAADRVRPPPHAPPPAPPRSSFRVRVRERLAFALAVTARRLDEPSTRRAIKAHEAR
jgi:hypothetical protein